MSVKISEEAAAKAAATRELDDIQRAVGLDPESLREEYARKTPERAGAVAIMGGLPMWQKLGVAAVSLVTLAGAALGISYAHGHNGRRIERMNRDRADFLSTLHPMVTVHEDFGPGVLIVRSFSKQDVEEIRDDAADDRLDETGLEDWGPDLFSVNDTLDRIGFERYQLQCKGPGSVRAFQVGFPNGLEGGLKETDVDAGFSPEDQKQICPAGTGGIASAEVVKRSIEQSPSAMGQLSYFRNN